MTFHDFPWLSLKFHDFPGLKIEIINSKTFQVFQHPAKTLLQNKYFILIFFYLPYIQYFTVILYD